MHVSTLFRAGRYKSVTRPQRMRATQLAEGRAGRGPGQPDRGRRLVVRGAHCARARRRQLASAVAGMAPARAAHRGCGAADRRHYELSHRHLHRCEHEQLLICRWIPAAILPVVGELALQR